MTRLELRALARSADLKAVRVACGIRRSTVARALGVPWWYIRNCEERRVLPGWAGVRYARVVLGMARHLEVRDISDKEGEPDDRHSVDR